MGRERARVAILGARPGAIDAVERGRARALARWQAMRAGRASA